MCRNTIRIIFLFLILYLIALEQSVHYSDMHIFTHFTDVFLFYVSLTRRHNSTEQLGPNPLLTLRFVILIE